MENKRAKALINACICQRHIICCLWWTVAEGLCDLPKFRSWLPFCEAWQQARKTLVPLERKHFVKGSLLLQALFIFTATWRMFGWCIYYISIVSSLPRILRVGYAIILPTLQLYIHMSKDRLTQSFSELNDWARIWTLVFPVSLILFCLQTTGSEPQQAARGRACGKSGRFPSYLGVCKQKQLAVIS